jgi:hypothetical protein
MVSVAKLSHFIVLPQSRVDDCSNAFSQNFCESCVMEGWAVVCQEIEGWEGTGWDWREEGVSLAAEFHVTLQPVGILWLTV